ncbi:iron-regulated protein [gamma proteobacterium BDW918]|uniref:Peptidase n=1 Tax=Zhongshania aliphaticivorans TaxID=1470434 RepID=A0A127M6D4_9GAMM|nr:imelysin family protein [Zhongshania aliphaticivorans]AMO68800.1 peptidase [Zhongshania aliphaticivorans]EIF43571.1 iron-regulated protein [gamma proteobacterium BDW918]
MSALFRHAFVLIACLVLSCFAQAEAQPETKVNALAVVKHYADLGHAIYSDAESSARQLQIQIDAFLQAPDQKGLIAAQKAWQTARIPYQQSEAFRFGNPVVDDWEHQLNSWPLDEGLIDYVAEDYFAALGNIGGDLNIIANARINLGGEIIDASTINAELLRGLHELGGSAANVATGYHAIEFLLWGQDLNGHELGAGERPYTDYSQGAQCTHGNCDRRAAYLRTAVSILVEDLSYMSKQWAPNQAGNYRSQLLALNNQIVLARIFNGMGSLSLGELGGERIKVSLEANSTEDEHDCFSDNTHWSHYYNGLGIENVYLGRYQRLNGDILRGPSLSDLVRQANPDIDKKTRQALSATMASLKVLSDTAEAKEKPMKFDMLIAEGNQRGEDILSAILKDLVAQTRAFEAAAAAINIDPTATGL